MERVHSFKYLERWTEDWIVVFDESVYYEYVYVYVWRERERDTIATRWPAA